MKRSFSPKGIAAFFALTLGTLGCLGTPVGGDGYPYNLYDSDLERFLAELEKGTTSELRPENLIREGPSDDPNESGLLDLKEIWGKVVKKTVVSRIHIGFKGFYHIQITLNDGSTRKVRVVYSPNMGRVELGFKLLPKAASELDKLRLKEAIDRFNKENPDVEPL